MEEPERRRFESIETLRRAAYERFNDRRAYEWKFSLGIWTAEAVFLAGLVQPVEVGEISPMTARGAWIAAAMAGTLLVAVHGYWSKRAARAHSIDKEVSHFFGNAMQEMLNLPFSDGVAKEISDLRKAKDWKLWSHTAQATITLLLAAAIVLVIAARSV